MRFLTLAACVPLALAHLASYAQGDVVLRGKDVNESNLIEALTPERNFRTRSIRVSPSTDKASPVRKAAAASMLITFETNSAELKPEARKMLDSLGKAMTSDKLSNFRFAIEGHADPRGGEQFNLELSQRRAEAVVSYLTENHRIDAARLQPVGKGQSELFNRTQIDAPENRRVTVKTLVE
jgi:outer membrane protein OmpA-like peptidoglycan-associated protein